jgi:catechol 2,3-dioxygenase-like lactoylglutathione lyase family enzyme
VSDLPAAVEHYRALGFDVEAYASGDEYAFARRDGIELHLAARESHPRVRGGATYLYVRDADALYAQWTKPGIGGQTWPVGPTEYGLREGSHVDPDGNLIRFGAPLPAETAV